MVLEYQFEMVRTIRCFSSIIDQVDETGGRKGSVMHYLQIHHEEAIEITESTITLDLKDLGTVGLAKFEIDHRKSSLSNFFKDRNNKFG